ncbi:hypothetical protein ACT4VJ_06415 [Acinetobacter baumannii]|uniref:hypothetical protein n=1 Tax=Acinetobacter calcoaceticus/baumannii complex TaxID=909768 RepID=UPI00112EB7E8|nr:MULTISPECIES: hypothetical protein [Acinetobacter calcoaceticus/baumannii complex]MDC4436895.1 hypothetical protein [Acinetobacter baumannii]TPU09484.1 hypothetical protein FJV00_10945 [Acinetobacter baumannii]
MSEWKAEAGDAFFCQAGPKEHLFVVLFDPDTFPNEGYGKRLCIVSVNFTSVTTEKKIDPACIIEAGEHPFIQHQSFVLYERIQIMDHQHVCHCVNTGVYRPATKVSVELLDRIICGIQDSSFTPRKFKKLLK